MTRTATSDPGAVGAVVVHPVTDHTAGRDPDLRLEEAAGLAQALDMDVRGARVDHVRDIRPSTFFGRGKVEELAAMVADTSADVVVVDSAVTPVQQRNLETALRAKVLDRTGLILEIFGLRARTKEGRLQVELARLAYERSRLVRTWTHLERQRGGRGFLSGPGETQIEADRRAINEKIARLRKELGDVRRTRGLHRAHRKKAPFPLVVLVGYTNAGKSTLFNALTDAQVLAKDMVFATLDPTLRSVALASGVKAMLADTVGFISDLPTDLIEAFQATLEEVREADLLLHVRDIAHQETEGQRVDVETVLAALGVGESQETDAAQRRIIEVWNKADLLDEDDRDIALLRTRRGESEPPVLVSAKTGAGLDALMARIDDIVTEGSALMRYVVPPSEGKALAWLHEHGAVLDDAGQDDGSVCVTARLSALAAGRFARMFPAVIPQTETAAAHRR